MAILSFSIDDLRECGFTGFVRVATPKSGLVPFEGGVYVVVREATAAPRFLTKSAAPTYKRMDPTVSVERLESEWVDGAQVLYFGGTGYLHDRVGLLGRFDERKLGRWGGRLLWQLDGWPELLVAWRVEPDHHALERKLIDEFVAIYGRLPFANLVRGNGRTSRSPSDPGMLP